jgi:hypothetical protein
MNIAVGHIANRRKAAQVWGGEKKAAALKAVLSS